MGLKRDIHRTQLHRVVNGLDMDCRDVIDLLIHRMAFHFHQ
jgi:hypothetical protein